MAKPSGNAKSAERNRDHPATSAKNSYSANSELDKSTTICKVGDLEDVLKPFWIWKIKFNIYTSIKYTSEVYAYEVHAREVHTH